MIDTITPGARVHAVRKPHTCVICEHGIEPGMPAVSGTAPDPALDARLDVRGVAWDDKPARINQAPPQLVRVRPDGETPTGILVGDPPVGGRVTFNRETQIAHVSTGLANPVIVIPSFGRLVYGAESWRGRIDSAEDISDITSDTISRSWAALVPDAEENDDA